MAASTARVPDPKWQRPVELERDGLRRTVVDLADPDAFVVATQELTAEGWRAAAGPGAVVLTRAAMERLIIAVGFR